MWPESVWSLLLMECWVVTFGGLNLDVCNKLWLNFCLKQIENNGPLINMIYKVLKNSAQGLLSSIHVRLLALKCAHPIAFSISSQCSGFYRCFLVHNSAFCKIFFYFPCFFPFFWSLYAKLWLTSVFGFILSCFENECVKQWLQCEILKMWKHAQSSLCCHVDCLIVNKFLTVLIM